MATSRCAGVLRNALGLCGAACVLAASFPIGCGGKESPEEPMYLVVELLPSPPSGPTVGAAVVEITRDSTVISQLCVKIPAAGESAIASFAMTHPGGDDVDPKLRVKVTPYTTLAGEEYVAAGREFTCRTDALMPEPASPSQSITTTFCHSRTVRVSFQLGSSCGCRPTGDGGITDADAAPGDGKDSGTDGESVDAAHDATSGGDAGCGCDPSATCGAGLSTTGNACQRDECCPAEIKDACLLPWYGGS